MRFGLNQFIAKNQKLKMLFWSGATHNNYIIFEDLENKGFNLTQGMALLLLKPLNLPANFVLNLIIFITDPKNNIGY